MGRIKTIILGAMGRDYHNFLTFFKNNPNYEVVAFTTSQIIEKHRKFPRELAGKLYKRDIPVHPESELPELIRKLNVDFVFLAYSDLSNQDVHEKASIVLASGANFGLLGTKDTYIKSKKPVIAVTAVRTGSGKSQTSRAIAKILKKNGKKVIAVRHSMPYGNLLKQRCQRFASAEDFKKHNTSIEEEEEYQPWIDNGFVVYAGVDYREILKQAERESDILIKDGGNNDWSFIKPDLNIVVADPHRAGHELTYYPGFVNFLLADVIVINKVDSAKKENILLVKEHSKQYNPKAKIVLARSEIFVDKPELIRNKSVILIEDGPSLTHGGMPYGAGTIVAKRYKCKVVNAQKYAVGSIKEVYRKYPHLKNELPAMGYSNKQIKELEKTINLAKCDTVIDATPANLSRILKINKPIAEVTYELGIEAVKKLESILKEMKFI